MEASHGPVAPPPPPRVCGELPDWQEGTTGERSPRVCLHEVQGRIHERLRWTGRHDEALAESSFQQRLARYLQRMPERYIVDVDSRQEGRGRAAPLEDPRRLRRPRQAALSSTRASSCMTVQADYNSGDEEHDKPCRRLMEDLSLEGKTVHGNDAVIMSSRVIHVHEIIFCSVDKRKLLSRVAELLDEVGLHILEGHLYCTVDGFCLAIFSVDGWETEDTDGLVAKIYETLALKTCGQRKENSVFRGWSNRLQAEDARMVEY
ncbi:hypothetical protein EJB05_09613, partial [Eragrostis curvula]